MPNLAANTIRYAVLLLTLLTGFSQAADKRVALVIGNNAYQSVPALAKAANDARAMGHALEKAGFRTISVIDGTRNQMNTAVNQFVDEVSGGGIGVLFFAGHGVQVSNQNFLIPVDLQGISREADLADQGISLQGIQDKLADAKAKFTLLVIDACRDNPLPKKAGRSFGGRRGLAAASSAEGQIVIFSAGAHQQALDSLNASDSDPNGVFTREFLPWLAKPGVTIRDAVLGVRSAVRAKAKSVDHEQFPAIYDQAEGDFYFTPGTAMTGPAQPVASLVPGVVAARTPQQIEDELWDSIKNSGRAAVFEEYLKHYPNGRYLAQAKVKLAGLKVMPPQAPPPATPPATSDPDSAMWNEVKAAGAREYFDAYLAQYPQGKYAALARLELKKFDDQDVMRKAQEEANRKAAADKLRQEAGALFEPEMVALPIGIAMSRTPITQKQWRALMGGNPSRFANCGEHCPVEQVSWNDAQEYIRILNQRTGKNYRLPKEKEWSAACRAGRETKYCGSDNLDAVAWQRDNSGNTTHPVAQKQPNAWGLYDMSGNVNQWMEDCHNSNCSHRMLRGGSWHSFEDSVRLGPTNGGDAESSYHDSAIGFRVVR